MFPVVKGLSRRVGHTQSSFSCISMAILTVFVDNWRTYHVILIDLYQTNCQLAHAFVFCYVTVGQDEVVVNHCFTSLFGTNGLLSDIVIR